MLLADVVTASEAVAATRSRTAKAELVAELLRRADPAELPVVTSWMAGEPRQRTVGVGWRTLAPFVEPAAEGGAGEAPPLQVAVVDDLLERLASTSGAGSAARRAVLLGELFAPASGPERRFLVRLLTGELRQGALEGVVLDAVVLASGAPAAQVRRAAMLSGSLAATASAALVGGEPALEAVRLEVMRPVHPMLASPGGTVQDVLDDAARRGLAVVVEPKLDGARIQVHLDRGAADGVPVRVWTRTLREVTAGLPEVAERVLALPCDSAVLDGETLALDDDGRPRAFQDTMSRFGSDGPGGGADSAEVLLSPFFFDLLHLDGRDLLDEPLARRLAALDALLAAPEHAALRMPGERGADAAGAAAVLERALADGHEGVVVKDLAAPYAAGRRGRAWQKVKPVHTLDLLVVGAEWGYGRRTGSLSNVHLAARDPGGGPPLVVGKTFKGMTDALLAWQTQTFPGLAVEERRWGLQLRPELVVEVAVDGAQRSSRYPGGVALRFARVLRYRPDKTADQADDVGAVRSLL